MTRTNSNGEGSARGQANLLVVAVALVVLVAVTGTAVAMAKGAMTSAERDSFEYHAATTAADRLVAEDANVTRRANVLDREAVAELTASDVDALAPPVADADIRVRIDDRIIVERGNPTGGTTVRRLALLAHSDERVETVDLSEERTITIPRRTTEVTLRFGPDDDAETVRVNDRVVLHDPNGLEGDTTVELSRYETLAVDIEGTEGDVDVVAYPETTNKALVEVTVDD